MPKPMNVLVCLNSISDSSIIANAFNMVRCNSTILPADGERVLVSIVDGLYDYVIMNSCLSGIDAAQIISEASDALHLPKFIVIDPVYSETTHKLLMSVGAACYLIKPLGIEQIVDKVLMISGCCDLNAKVDSVSAEMSSLKAKICELFRRFGIPASINGYSYLMRAIELTVGGQAYQKKKVTKDLYPTLAREFNTTPSRVERAMRHAITIAWNRGDIEALESFFGYTVDENKGKPTNSEFIAMIAEASRHGELEYSKAKKAL